MIDHDKKIYLENDLKVTVIIKFQNVLTLTKSN